MSGVWGEGYTGRAILPDLRYCLAAEAVALTADWEQDDSTAEVESDYAHVLRLAGKDREARQMAERALARYQRKGNLVGARRAQAFLGRNPVTSAGRDPSSR